MEGDSPIPWDKESLAEARRRLSSRPPWLLEHCEAVAALCRELARIFGEDEEKAELTGLLHDITRDKSPEELLRLARDFNLTINEIEKKMPLLLHGAVAAEILRREWGIKDEDILDAVRHHTNAAPGMSKLAKIVFLADKLEPGKAKLYPGLGKVRKLARRNLDQALLEFLNWQIAFLARRKAILHPAALQARDELLKKG